MAYDKPLKTQWIEVNGRPVPLVLPQFWDEDKQDWVVSSTANRLPVDAQLTGSNVEIPGASKIEVETIVDAESVEPDGSILIPPGAILRNNCHEMWFALSIDQQPWRMVFRSFFSTSLSTDVFFPETGDITTTHSQRSPFLALYHRFSSYNDIQKPQTLKEAKEIILPYEEGEDLVGRVYNDSEDIATVGLRVIMIWR